MRGRGYRRAALLALLLTVWGGGLDAAYARPKIALIVDDMGNSLTQGRAALALPGAVTYAFLPHSPHGRHLARQAHALGREVMLHLPLESIGTQRLGPGGLTLNMSPGEFHRTLATDIASIPFAVGVNNHMGSLMTRHPGAMQWLMQTLNERGLFFIDSRTTDHTVAARIARENAVPSASRDVFLDHVIERSAIRAQFRRLLRLARRRGTAIGIGHPHPQTLAVLAEELPRLAQAGVRLVPVSQLTRIYLRRPQLWHASSFPSPKVAKSSKPSPSSTCCVAPR